MAFKGYFVDFDTGKMIVPERCFSRLRMAVRCLFEAGFAVVLGERMVNVIMTTIKGINRTNDYAFKRIFGSSESHEVILGFLNAVLKLPKGKQLKRIEFKDRELEPEFLADKNSRLDILAETDDGILVNIEVQIANKHNIDKRILFYFSKLYQGQLKSGYYYNKLTIVEQIAA